MNSDDTAGQDAVDTLGPALADPAVWAQPTAELQEQIVAAINRERAAARRSRSIRYALSAGAAALVLAVGIAVGTSSLRDDDALRYSASLSATELSVGAHGTVTLTRTSSGWKIELRGKGLPRRADGGYYEAWLKNADGVLVPVGTFNELTDVTLWAGVSPATHPTFTVTRQLADGDPASSGQVVLIGTASRQR